MKSVYSFLKSVAIIFFVLVLLKGKFQDDFKPSLTL